MEVVNSMEGMVHGFDFATVLATYWRGFQEGSDEKKDAALRWLRGEFATRTDARQALGVRVIVDDDSWYDYLKLFARFVASIGYKGLLVLIDEGVNLYKITQTVARQANYEKLLTMFNDTMQGKAEYLGILLGGTPQFVEDPRRGLYSYEAMRSRLAESRFVKDGLKDMSGPIVRLQQLTQEEIFVLLMRLAEVHAAHYEIETSPTPQDLQDFMQEVANRLGAEQLLTPREVVRDFISVLNLLRQNPGITFGQVVHGQDFRPTPAGADPEIASAESGVAAEGSQFAEFKL
jgi:uncharacterized protein (DUF2267 family)